MNPLIPPQTNLAVQIIILAMLFVSLVLKQRGKHLLHGVTMLVVVVLNAISFLLVMWPTFSSLEGLIASYTFDRISLTTVFHAIFGTIAEILAIWIVFSWRLRSSTQQCVRKRKMMRVVLVLWVIALLLGFLLYALLNTNLIA